MKQTIEHLREAVKALPEDDPHRLLMEETASKLEEKKSDAEKDMGVSPVMISEFMFMGGAINFQEADDFHDGQQIDMTIENEKNIFDQLHRNIWNSERSITEKARLTEQAASDLARRIGEVDEEGERETSLLQKAKTFFFGPDKIRTATKAVGEIIFLKDSDGSWRWLAIHSNNYFDRDKEVFPAAAHKEFESFVDATENYPELRLWHVPGSRMGVADFLAYDEPSGFMLSSGTFDKGMEDVAERLAQDDSLACSHGYRFREKDLDEEGVYARYRSFEVTILPAARAANPWTAISVGQIEQEVRKGMKKEKRQFLLEKLGEERTLRIEAQLASLGKELDEAGVSFKDVLEETDGAPASDAVAANPAAAAAPAGDPAAAAAQAPAATDVAPAASAQAPVADPAAAATQEPDAGASDPAEVSGQKAPSDLMAAFNTAIREQLAPITAAIEALKVDVKGLKETDDSKVADAMKPRVDVSAAAAQRPTTNDGNVITDPEKAKQAVGDDDADKEKQPISPYVEMALNGGRAVTPTGQ